MRQVLVGSNGPLVARMPAPSVAPGAVVVRVRYSLISTGTELASLAPITSSIKGDTLTEQMADLSSKATYYLGKAARDPRKAIKVARNIVTSYIASRTPQLRSAPSVPPQAPKEVRPLVWSAAAASKFATKEAGGLELVTDESPANYQAISDPIAITKGLAVELRLEGDLDGAPLGLGLLNEDRSSWIALLTIGPGPVADTFAFEVPDGCTEVTVVLCNAGAAKASKVSLERAEIRLTAPDASGLPVSEMGHQGWNVGYSAAGEVIAVGAGVQDVAVGDLVACAGAGQANHADYVVVRRNLVARIPKGCSLQAAATTTVGTIALQGVRRADPRLGEVVAVIGLGLIGMITVQLLRAAGARVIGMDINESRVAKARELGIDAASSNPAELATIIRDMTGGHGVDATLITAASKSHTLINQAMEITRRRGRVVIVGDVGLKVDRANFYRKEIDLLMSTSYGPGRYDHTYEEQGHDYPYAYVRFTLNRNMQTYLDLIARGQIAVDPLIELIVPIDNAPEAYRRLAQSGQTLPLGVLLEYQADLRPLPQPKDARRIVLRGGQSPQRDRIGYALIGAGAFGTHMLVPQMDKRPDRFQLRAVVSRDAVRGSNFARSRRVAVLASDPSEVLSDPAIDLVVIATRHDDHADQVVAALAAGKAVFVEKPLAITWDGLEKVREALVSAGDSARLMVGFNRRFAPAVTRLRQEICDRRSPLIISYRLNGGYIPKDHWIQNEHGGGRNIGEACHMYDLFRSLAGAEVASISATSIAPPESAAHLRNDNFAATIRYADGSVGNLVYTALGPKEGLPKERIEIFVDGEAYLIDDFKSLTRCSTDEVLWQARTAEKGHFEELSSMGDALARDEPMPIPVEEILETTAVSLHIEDLIYGRA
jgi:predicted dehydrogenase/threonine dehydrogenase-like Zn-dependent dehydrogenase